MNPRIQFRKSTALSLVVLLLACYALPHQARAVTPAPDGGYPGANTAEGQNALLSLTTGTYNTAVGIYSLKGNTTGSYNTAIGAGALVANTAAENTATGFGALFTNSTGNDNTANGALALFNNSIGNNNTAIGTAALQSNTGGQNNTATGFQALISNNIGGNNTANGYAALASNVGGGNNTGVGHEALFANSTGNNNTALGFSAGSNLTTGDNNIDIGYNVLGAGGESNTIRIGNSDINTTIIRGISGQTVPSGATVLVDSNGLLGTVPSSRRFKDGIKPMDRASEPLFALKPVTFRYKNELDPAAIQQFGLVAEDVEKVNPDLVARDAEGKAYTVRYEQINAMLLNEFLKEHRTVQELEANAVRQQKQIEALTAGLQKLSAQLELSKSSRRTVLNEQ